MPKSHGGSYGGGASSISPSVTVPLTHYGSPAAATQEWGGYGGNIYGGGKGGSCGGGGGGGLRTLHFTNLPSCGEGDFKLFCDMSFPGLVEFVKFKDLQDGRPPVAWVLFREASYAAQVAGSHMRFEWQNATVRCQLASTQLNPSKFRR